MTTTITEVRDKQYKLEETIDLLTSLKSIEINPVEACTRRCSFCPRSNPKLYPTTNKRITLETCEKIAKDLQKINYTGRVGFVGFGEPLLHKQLEQCISVIRQYNPDITYIEVVTNGDLLTTTRIKSLHDAGCNLIAVSMYESDITENIEALRGEIPIEIVYRHHYDATKNYNLELVNRNEITFGKTYLNIESPCYIPFYKLFIDWNGDILTCQNDWSRTLTFGNVNTESVRDIWLGYSYNAFKSTLKAGKRTIEPCNKCNVCGIRRGEVEFNMFNSN